MIKKLLISGLIALSPMAVLAADITNVEFDNGDVTVSGKGASTVQATFRVVVSANEVVEYVQVDVAGDNLAPVDHSVGGNLGLQEGTHKVKVSVKLPPNTGTFDLDVQTAGIYGGIRAIDGDDNENGNETFSDALRTVSSSSSTTNNDDDEDSAPAWLTVLMAQLQAQMAALIASLKPATPATGGSPVPASLCSQIPQGDTFALQAFLMAHGQAGPFHAIGVYAPTGFRGNATESALSAFKWQNNCW